MKRYSGLDLLGTSKVTGLADPSNPTDAVTLQYLQAFVRGLTWKEPVRAASTANVSITSPGAAIDGVTLASGNRVLLKNQTSGAENGVYVWTGSASALTRATDLDSASELVGAVVTVLEGTTNANTVYTQSTDTITLGTTALAWVPVGGSQSPYTAGTNGGLQLTGSAFSVVVGNGILVDATGVRVDPAVVTRKNSTNATANATQTFTHGLNTLDVAVTFREISTGAGVEADWTATDVNTVTVTFATAPAAGAIRITVQG